MGLEMVRYNNDPGLERSVMGRSEKLKIIISLVKQSYVHHHFNFLRMKKLRTGIKVKGFEKFPKLTRRGGGDFSVL